MQTARVPLSKQFGRRQLLAGLALLAVPGCGSIRHVASTRPQTDVPVSETGEPHWDYDAEGPDHWAELDSRYVACKAGHEQSPIDLPGHTQLDQTDHIGIEYGEIPSVELVHNGHTLVANPPAGGTNRILIGEQSFRLVQFHFHIHSEHTVDGVATTMELHLVHKSDSGRSAVLGILMQEATGRSVFDAVLGDIPNRQGAKVTTGPIDLRTFLPSDLGQFRYEGSLTTPPCTEGVAWTVLRTAVAVSPEAVDRYRALFPHTNRPTQPVNGRVVSGGR